MGKILIEDQPWISPKKRKILSEFEGSDEYLKGVQDLMEKLEKERYIPARFQVGDPIGVNYLNHGIIPGKVIKVHFTEATVMYDVEIEMVHPQSSEPVQQRIYNVSSSFVLPLEEVV